ncbi:MAG: hypothetical protein A2Y17_00740 [Clostridiales bacterium GWF2_38_85]|nr:MAG: hypothetical protein A2Y17_00740 [Clostridiales bacterium GWF2_38_85]
MLKINLKELVEQMDFMHDEWSYFVKKTTGKIISVQDRYLSSADDTEEELAIEILKWERDEIKVAEDILRNFGDYIPLPDKYLWDEYSIMEKFSENFPDGHISECLCISISGKGAFRRFKDTINRHGIAEKWYLFKETALTEFAKKWCKENELEWTEDTK